MIELVLQITTMHISSLAFTILLVLSTICILEAARHECKKNKQCAHTEICAMCIEGRGPACATAKCCKHKCVQIAPCSLDFTVSTKIKCPKKVESESSSESNSSSDENDISNSESNSSSDEN